MKKTSLTRALLVAGGLALAGIGAAQADAIFYPNGTMVDLGPTGADNLALSSDSSVMAMSNAGTDTTVLGAGPSTVTTTTVTAPVQYEYVQPNINWDPVTARAQARHNRQAMRRIHRGEVPLASSDAIVVGSYSIPYSEVAVASTPYYVFSY